MYAGHLGVALGVRGVRRDAPLWLLVIATQACDWVQVLTCMMVPRESAMLSHSLPAVAALAFLFTLVALVVTRSTGASVAIAVTAISHVLADYVTGVKPTWRGGPTIGLSLYDHPVADVFVETVVVIVGWLLYRRSLDPQVRPQWLTWLLLLLLVGVQLVGALKLAWFPSPKCS